MPQSNNNSLSETAILSFMNRALQLAQLGAGAVSPNPMVGCVIVHQGTIVGEGWHQRYGDWHAEVNAVNDVADKSILSESEVFVTLEPCSHFGKTPPCADLLVKHRVKKVYICNDDPNPLVAGKGIQKLRNAGIEVVSGILAEKGRELNKRFFTFFEKKRPYIILKWAQSSDRKIALPQYQAIQISNALSRRWTHKLRSEEDAIMVGTRTAQFDNPSLDNRFWTGKSPIRILIDKDLRIADNAKIYSEGQKTICYNLQKEAIEGDILFCKIPPQTDLLSFLIDDLYQKKVQSLIVEGGAYLLNSLIKTSLWDEALVWESSMVLGDGIAAPILEKPVFAQQQVGDNILKNYRANP
ncbi:bifunctional diaminohydroxyphosphoribosylaminopyrimidine deaminase/5-amino-6-(5-phosphoribosylamino)uracil reductase RibD [Flectobacillus major]|uniref:bifunctional diaminohydroxyphosphoribosylaminopyrimidine deaminase/5-amino-6-(5-phosphoribosylamino)uracil reductase RibD n=1 Tax=Flectobacillus major TaxID=103 RepID=UPI0004006605|nr:bifunctional diaminohydroxyphosphoribosylaminopyrimidine deaminase/5-amino-6-(5-phosphoribosylamino)uracil reductase RibD [Flectobacillus major]